MRRLPILALLAAVGSLVAGASAAAPHAGRQTSFAPRIASDSTVSTNWSGYAVTTPAAASSTPVSFTDVAGTWVQPRVKCSGEVGAAAFWVGLGGWDQASQALEQIGTEATCNARRQVTYSAWYELVPAGPVTIKLKIRPKDHVTAAVLVSGTQITLSLKNLTRHTRFTKRIGSSSALDTGSAEWIAEAPSLCSSRGRCTVVPLSNFGTVTFTGAATIGNGHPGTISDPTWFPAQVVLAADPNASSGVGSAANTHGATPSSASADGRSFAVTWRQTG